MNPATALVVLCDMVFLSLEGKHKPGLEAIARSAVEVLKAHIEKHEPAEGMVTNGASPEPTTELG